MELIFDNLQNAGSPVGLFDLRRRYKLEKWELFSRRIYATPGQEEWTAERRLVFNYQAMFRKPLTSEGRGDLRAYPTTRLPPGCQLLPNSKRQWGSGLQSYAKPYFWLVIHTQWHRKTREVTRMHINVNMLLFDVISIFINGWINGNRCLGLIYIWTCVARRLQMIRTDGKCIGSSNLLCLPNV